MNEHQPITHGIVHAGFRGLRRFMARKKSRCKLIGNRFVIPHDTIPSNDSYSYHPSFDYFGGGGLLSTTADLCLFYHGLFSHKVFKNKSTLDTMLAPVLYVEPQSLDYRMGIWAIEINGMKAYTHSGFWGTQVVYIPEIETAIAANYSQRWTVRGIAPVIAKVLSAVEAT